MKNVILVSFTLFISTFVGNTLSYADTTQYTVMNARITSLETQSSTVLIFFDQTPKQVASSPVCQPNAKKDRMVIIIDGKQINSIRYSLALAAYTQGRRVSIWAHGCTIYPIKLDIKMHKD